MKKWIQINLALAGFMLRGLYNDAAGQAVQLAPVDMRRMLCKLLDLPDDETTTDQVIMTTFDKFGEPDPAQVAAANEAEARRKELWAKLGLPNEATLADFHKKVLDLAGLVDSTNTAFANEREARIGLELNELIRAGRITVAEMGFYNTQLKDSASFDEVLGNLKKKAPVIKVGSVTQNLGDRKNEAQASAKEEFAGLVNARQAVTKDFTSDGYILAWNYCKEKHAALFAQMETKQS